MSKLLLSGLGIVAILSLGVNAADDDTTTGTAKTTTGDTMFDNHVDSWIKGTITALDTDGQKFSVRGYELPYATEYSKMMKEIRAKTANLAGDAKTQKETEIRNSWQDRLNNARTRTDTREADYNFKLPAEGKLTVLMDNQVQNVQFLNQDRLAAGGKEGTGVDVSFKGTTGTTSGDKTNAHFDSKETKALLTLRDLKVGQNVLIGYDDGVITNEAYVVVQSSGKGTSTTTGTTGTTGNTGTSTNQNNNQNTTK